MKDKKDEEAIRYLVQFGTMTFDEIIPLYEIVRICYRLYHQKRAYMIFGLEIIPKAKAPLLTRYFEKVTAFD